MTASNSRTIRDWCCRPSTFAATSASTFGIRRWNTRWQAAVRGRSERRALAPASASSSGHLRALHDGSLANHPLGRLAYTAGPLPSPLREDVHNVTRLKARGTAAALLLTSLLAGCSSRPPAETPAPIPQAPAAAAPVAAAPEHHHMAGMPTLAPIPQGALYTAADVHFMQGMI